MATKRARVETMIKTDMEGRDIGKAVSVQPDTMEPKKAGRTPVMPRQKPGKPAEAHKTRAPRPPKEAVKINLDEGDYGILQEIAAEQGTMASVLIRQAVKQIIKTYRG